jgi:hypothetical protein
MVAPESDTLKRFVDVRAAFPWHASLRAPSARKGARTFLNPSFFFL